MKKTTLFLAFILTLSITAIILSSCASNTTPLAPVTVTKTVTETLASTQVPATVTSTQTVTVTQTVAPAPLAATADVPQIANRNNSRFLVGRGITGYTKKVNIDGSITESPVYEDSFLDLNLSGFYTHEDAAFVAKVPTITNIDQWILNFKITTVNFPVVVNWGYITKSGKADPTLAFSIWRADLFKTLYSTNPATLINGKGSTTELYLSADGVHVQNINEPYAYTALIHTQNTDDILGWWVKTGVPLPK